MEIAEGMGEREIKNRRMKHGYSVFLMPRYSRSLCQYAMRTEICSMTHDQVQISHIFSAPCTLTALDDSVYLTMPLIREKKIICTLLCIVGEFCLLIQKLPIFLRYSAVLAKLKSNRMSIATVPEQLPAYVIFVSPMVLYITDHL